MLMVQRELQGGQQATQNTTGHAELDREYTEALKGPRADKGFTIATGATQLKREELALGLAALRNGYAARYGIKLGNQPTDAELKEWRADIDKGHGKGTANVLEQQMYQLGKTDSFMNLLGTTVDVKGKNVDFAKYFTGQRAGAAMLGQGGGREFELGAKAVMEKMNPNASVDYIYKDADGLLHMKVTGKKNETYYSMTGMDLGNVIVGNTGKSLADIGSEMGPGSIYVP